MDDENEIAQFQKLQQNLQQVATQLETAQSELEAKEEAVKELKSSEGEAFKSVGGIMVRRDREELVGELEDEKEDLELQVDRLEKKRENLVEKIRDKQSSMRGGQ